MGFFDIFSSKSSSSNTTSTSTSTNITDLRAGAEGGGSAITQPQFEGNLIVGSDDVAQSAIEAARGSSENALVQSTNFLSETFGRFLTSVDRSQERAQANVTASRTLAKDLISKEQETGDDRLIGLVKMGLLAGVAMIALQSGVLKEVGKVLK